jgi:hypothetical protein
MTIKPINYKFFFLLIIFGLFSCEEQRDEAIEYFNNRGTPAKSTSEIERFGFDDKPTPRATPKVIVPFDNQRTRENAESL